MIITSKKSLNRGVKSMSAKAMSWSQVCKALSGIGGYVEISDKKKVRPLELMQSLGVHVRKNSYKPADIFTAWAARMTVEGRVCMAHNVPIMVNISGKDYRLYKLDGEKYRGYSELALCPLVSATDKADKTDVIVSTTNILKGLYQSVFVDATLKSIDDSHEKAMGLTEGYVNVSTNKKVDVWKKVVKAENGTWSIETEKREATNAKREVKNTTKRTNKRSTKKSEKAA